MCRLLVLAVLINVGTCAANERSTLGGVAFATTEDMKHKMTQIAGPTPGTLAKPDYTIIVDDSPSGKRQIIDGFGAAWTDGTVEVFDILSSEDQQSVMEDLFGESGIGLSFMRHTIGQSDITPYKRWSFDENDGRPDPDLTHFNLTRHGQKMLGWMRRMFQINPDILNLGSVWSPPGWMKNQGNELKEEYVDAWVNYFIKYLQAAKEQGVKVDALTIQNEPGHNGDQAWTMFLNHTDAVQYSNRLSAAMKKAGLETEIWGWDHSTGIANVSKTHPNIANYPEYVIENSPAVNTVAWHCYDFAGRHGLEQWKDLTDFHNAHPEVRQYMTECWTHLLFLGKESFFDLPDFVIGPLRNYAQGSLAWVLGGSSVYDIAYPGGCPSCSGIVQVHKPPFVKYAFSYEKTQDFYNLGQFSKYVKTGAVYLSDSNDETSSDIQTVQVRNPNGDLVVVVANKHTDGQKLQIDFKSAGSFSGLLPARSVTTWVFSSAVATAQPMKGERAHVIDAIVV